MSKKKLLDEPKRTLLGDEYEQTVNLLVSLGFTPMQVDAMATVADGEGGPEVMVSAGFWAYVADLFVKFDELSTADLVRAGFSTVQAEALTA